VIELRFQPPRIPAGALSNLVGLLGLLGVALAVGGLTGNWWWSALVGGVFAVGLAVLAQQQQAAQQKPSSEAQTQQIPRIGAA
jgi:hypothetical protein